MKLIRTVKIPIKNKELYPKLSDTLFFYTLAYNHVCQLGFKSDSNITTNGISLHQKSYEYIRNFLPAQLACSARTKATESLKSVKLHINQTKKKNKQRKKKSLNTWKIPSCPLSRKQTIRYDKNSYSVFMNSMEISLLTTSGRIRIPLEYRPYYKQYINWKHTSADLILDRKGKFWFHIVFEKDIADPIINGNRIGIDRGINNIAVTSNNKFFNGKEVKRIVNKRNKLRSNLQKAADNGSKSAKRHLAKLSGKERRFRKDVNHCISKQIINMLNSGDTIILEDLTGIRTYNRFKKSQRREFNNWPFYQLDMFLTYKAEAKGIIVEYADARYTSQRCSRCNHTEKKNRKGSEFKCKSCGFRLNADLNAARNISKPSPYTKGIVDGAEINQPNIRFSLENWASS